jgi:hypothetical protein
LLVFERPQRSVENPVRKGVIVGPKTQIQRGLRIQIFNIFLPNTLLKTAPFGLGPTQYRD